MPKMSKNTSIFWSWKMFAKATAKQDKCQRRYYKNPTKKCFEAFWTELFCQQFIIKSFVLKLLPILHNRNWLSPSAAAFAIRISKKGPDSKVVLDFLHTAFRTVFSTSIYWHFAKSTKHHEATKATCSSLTLKKWSENHSITVFENYSKVSFFKIASEAS